MTTTALYVPVTSAQATALRAGIDLGTVAAHAPGPALREAHGLGPTEEEAAGFVALGYAGLAALLDHPGPRLVLAADVDDEQLSGAGGLYGEVEVADLRWEQVQAIFADEPSAAADLEAARSLAGDRALSEVADDEDVVSLVDRWDLLWFAPQELDAVT